MAGARYRLAESLVWALAVAVPNWRPLDAQSLAEAPPAFEVASVRQNKSGAVRAEFRPEPGRLTVRNFSLRFMIEQSYGVEDYQVAGGPGWLDSDKFDVEAKAAGDADKQQVRIMLRSLLAERFKLMLHRETREVRGYDLVVAKGGPKLRSLKSGETAPVSTAEIRTLPVHGDASTLAFMLTRVLSRPVVDKTGVTGSYDFTLQFRREEVPNSSPSGAGALTDLAASVFSALQEQFGLKLESTKQQIEVLVVDRVDRLSEN